MGNLGFAQEMWLPFQMVAHCPELQGAVYGLHLLYLLIELSSVATLVNIIHRWESLKYSQARAEVVAVMVTYQRGYMELPQFQLPETKPSISTNGRPLNTGRISSSLTRPLRCSCVAREFVRVCCTIPGLRLHRNISAIVDSQRLHCRVFWSRE